MRLETLSLSSIALSRRRVRILPLKSLIWFLGERQRVNQGVLLVRMLKVSKASNVGR